LAQFRQESRLAQRWAPQVTLVVTVTVAAQKTQPVMGFHAFHEHFRVHLVGNPENGLYDGRITLVFSHVMHESAIYLERIGRQLLERKKGGRSRAKIINRSASAPGCLIDRKEMNRGSAAW